MCSAAEIAASSWEASVDDHHVKLHQLCNAVAPVAVDAVNAAVALVAVDAVDAAVAVDAAAAAVAAIAGRSWLS